MGHMLPDTVSVNLPNICVKMYDRSDYPLISTYL